MTVGGDPVSLIADALRDHLRRKLGEAFRVLPGPHKSYARQRETIRLLNEAVLSRRTVEMRYRTGRTGEVATRRLDPYRIWYRSGGLYAIGHDHRSGEVRTFAVERIGAAELTDASFEIPESFESKPSEQLLERIRHFALGDG